MPIAVLQKKLKTIDESYYELISDFLDFVQFRQNEEMNGLDKAILEEKKGEVEHFKSFEEFKAAMA
jgi:hypothetical protein